MSALTKQTEKFSETELDEEIIVMLLDSGEFLSLTGTARDVWQLIDGVRTKGEVVAELAAEYDASNDEIARDVDEFVAALKDAALVAEA